MVVVGGADEAVIGDVHQLPQIQHAALAGDDLVHKLLGGDAGLLGLVLNLLAVLVGAGQKQHIIAAQALIAGHGVGGHSAVGVADVELIAGVVDRGRDIKAFAFHDNTSSRSQIVPLSMSSWGIRGPRGVGEKRRADRAVRAPKLHTTKEIASRESNRDRRSARAVSPK